MSKPKPLRLFLDSNVLTGGILAAWGLDKAVLSLRRGADLPDGVG